VQCQADLREAGFPGAFAGHPSYVFVRAC
jgi:hypothetical protein